jgi:rhodanese-related sulfurtransferase
MTRHALRLAAGIAALLISLVVAGCGAAAPASVPPAALSSAPAASGSVTALPLTVPVAQAEQLRQSGALVLDVREPSEWAAGHIAGATLIPLGQLPSRLAELPRDLAIVVVCHSGNRSAQGRDILRNAGFTAVTSMAGGMTAWLAAGMPVETGS